MMKKIKFFAFALVFSFASVAASTPEAETVSTDPKERTEQLENRVHEIWKMDFADLERTEKVTLREELKEIRKELKTTGLDNKVSISIGAIIIILLLILLL